MAKIITCDNPSCQKVQLPDEEQHWARIMLGGGRSILQKFFGKDLSLHSIDLCPGCSSGILSTMASIIGAKK